MKGITVERRGEWRKKRAIRNREDDTEEGGRDEI